MDRGRPAVRAACRTRAWPASRQLIVLALCCSFAAPASSAGIEPGAKPPSAASRKRQPKLEALIVAVRINGQPRGETFAYMAGRKSFLLRRQELAEAATLPASLEVTRIDGEDWVELNRIPGTQVKFDENLLELDVVLPPEFFTRQVFGKAGAKAAAPPPNSGPPSALLNYRVAYNGNDGGFAPAWTLATEQALTAWSWLARNQSFHVQQAGHTESVRFETQLVRDDRTHMRRLIVGDALSAGGELGGSVQMGGLRFSKAYELSPYFIRRQAASVAGTVTLPSDVELYVGDTRFLRQAVAPGPFEIGGIDYYGGQRDVRLVIRDMLGREQVIAYPFYFTDLGLAEGLHDYSYQAGVLRENFGAESNNYGDAAFSAFHRYGFTDAWTLGLRAEATADYGNAGPSVVYRNNHLGVISLNASGSHDRSAGRDGTALSLAHSFQHDAFSVFSAARSFSAHYALLHSGLRPMLPRHDLSGSLGYAAGGWGTLNLSYRQVRMPGQAGAQNVSLSYSKTIGRSVSALATYRHTLTGEAPDDLFVSLLFLPGGGHTASTSFNRNSDDGRSLGAQFGNTVPQGEGLTYRLGVQDQQDSLSSSRQLSPELRYFGRYGVASGELRTLQTPGASTSSYTLALAGAAAAVGGRFGFSRPINDSFGMAEISPPVAGVRVYQNSQEIGRTGEDGRLFLPSMTSFVDNAITIADDDVPIDYTIGRASRTVSPGFRSGSLLAFSVTRLQGFAGSFKYRRGKRLRALEYHEVTLEVNGETVTLQTGSNGDFYLENLPPGRYSATTQVRSKPCRFKLEIPESPDTIVNLGEVMTCHVAP